MNVMLPRAGAGRIDGGVPAPHFHRDREGSNLVRERKRLERQIDAIARRVPGGRDVVASLMVGRLRLVRIPLAFVLILGGFAGFLPILGFWMLPLGLLLLALDVPRIQPAVAGTLIRTRRRLQGWLRRRRRQPVQPAVAQPVARQPVSRRPRA